MTMEKDAMRLGTPLSPTAVKVMLLGSGELGKEVAIELQRLGCEVIAVDRYPNAPAMQVAHRSHVIAMTDAAALRALVEAERPHLIVPEIEAIATDELARIEADGLAVVIPTARAAQLTMNREGIRRLAAEELGLPTSASAFASTRRARASPMSSAPTRSRRPGATPWKAAGSNSPGSSSRPASPSTSRSPSSPCAA
jgi:phosphoribosylglycinamide formyltransferase 2